MAENTHVGHRERIRQSYQSAGAEKLASHVLLELLLYAAIPYKDVNATAHELLLAFGSFHAVFDAEVAQLTCVKGMTPRAARTVFLYRTAFDAYGKCKLFDRRQLINRELSVQYMRRLDAERVKDCFVLACLDGKYKVTALLFIAKAEQSADGLRTFLAKVLQHCPKSVIIATFYEGITPTQKQNEFTMRLLFSLSRMNIKLIDHLLLDEGEAYYSYAAEGLLHKYVIALERQDLTFPSAPLGEQTQAAATDLLTESTFPLGGQAAETGASEVLADLVYED